MKFDNTSSRFDSILHWMWQTDGQPDKNAIAIWLFSRLRSSHTDVWPLVRNCCVQWFGENVI